MEKLKLYWERYKYYFIIGGGIIFGIGLLIMRGTFLSHTPTPPSKVIMVTETKLSSDKKMVYIDIKGAVNNPGVYRVEDTLRVKDVIDLAGGVREDANSNAINMAQSVYDEMVIVIPSIQETESVSTLSAKAKLNLNTATKEQLMTIKGIGESKALAILAYRKEKGRLVSIDDLMNIKGFSKTVIDSIRDDVMVR